MTAPTPARVIISARHGAEGAAADDERRGPRGCAPGPRGRCRRRAPGASSGSRRAPPGARRSSGRTSSTSTGASRPVQVSNWATAWASSISRPPIVVQPAALRLAQEARLERVVDHVEDDRRPAGGGSRRPASRRGRRARADRGRVDQDVPGDARPRSDDGSRGRIPPTRPRSAAFAASRASTVTRGALAAAGPGPRRAPRRRRRGSRTFCPLTSMRFRSGRQHAEAVGGRAVEECRRGPPRC